jgi:hypothetical protein
MKRDRLAALVEAAANGRGYNFLTGEEHLIASTARVWPAAWLVPPGVTGHTGRREGETTLRLTLHLMTLPAAAEASPEALWQRLERDALEIAAEIAASSEVCAVGGIRCTPARQSLTPHGETSLSLQADVTMWYYL